MSNIPWKLAAIANTFEADGELNFCGPSCAPKPEPEPKPVKRGCGSVENQARHLNLLRGN